VECQEEEYPFWQFLVRLCAVIGGVYATVGMMYNHFSALGCSIKRFRRRSNDKTHNYTQIGSPLPNKSNSSPNTINPIISSSYATTNNTSLIQQPNFETPVVQFVGQLSGSEKSTLCDIAADSAIVTNLESDNSVLLPDLLASHHHHNTSS
jgi:hypothetical protein